MNSHCEAVCLKYRKQSFDKKMYNVLLGSLEYLAHPSAQEKGQLYFLNNNKQITTKVIFWKSLFDSFLEGVRNLPSPALLKTQL